MPRIVKWLLWTVAIAAAIVVLFLWVFPWVESMQQDPTLGAAAMGETTVAGPHRAAGSSLAAQEARSPR